MLFHLYLMREKGWILPRWMRATRPGVAGNLLVVEFQDPVLNRATRRAQLLDPVTGQVLESINPLMDAELIRFESTLIVLSGIERVTDILLDRTYDYAQTWWLEPAEMEQR